MWNFPLRTDRLCPGQHRRQWVKGIDLPQREAYRSPTHILHKSLWPTALINRINWFLFITETGCVYWAVRTGATNMIDINLSILDTVSDFLLSSSKFWHSYQVPNSYCMFLMQTCQFKFTLLIKTLVLKSTKLLFEIVNFSIYQKSICSGPCFKPLLSPFWSLRFHFNNSNIRRTSGQDLGAF